MNGDVAPAQQAHLSPVDVSAVLATAGYRWTTPRQIVVDAVLRQERPFTAEQLVTEIHAGHPGLGRSTVYRTLEILASVDVVTRLLQPEAHPTYVVGNPGHRHHLVCAECGATVAFTRCPLDELVADLTRDTDFAIISHHLEVVGLCPTCRGLSAAAP